MDACIFILTITMHVSVFTMDHVTQTAELSNGDKVCVMEIQYDDWMKVHWSSGNVGYTGYIHNIQVRKETEPTAPIPHEEEEIAPSPIPNTRSDNNLFPIPKTFAMLCYPPSGKPYGVITDPSDGTVGIVSRKVRPYKIFDIHNNESNHILYVAAKRNDQNRTLYFAFDYSKDGNDVSSIRVKSPNGYDSKDKCSMEWLLTKY